MKRLAGNQLFSFPRTTVDVPRREGIFTDVQAIGDDRRADVLHVDSQLMSPPGVRMQVHQRMTLKRFAGFVKRDGFARPPAGSTNHHLFADARMNADMRPNEVGLKFRNTSHDGSVFLLHFSLFELPTHLLVHLIVFRNQNDSRGVAVETVDDARSVSSANIAELIEMKLQRRGQGSGIRASSGMHDHAGRFVHNNDGFIFVQDVQRNVFRLEVAGIRIRQLHVQPIVDPQSARSSRGQSVQRDVTRFNGFLQLSSTVVAEDSVQIVIQPPAVCARFDGQVDRFSRGLWIRGVRFVSIAVR